MQRPSIAIVNSSSFGKHFPEHLTRLEEWALVSRFNFAAKAPSTEISKALTEIDGIIASVSPMFSAEVLQALPKLVLIARHGIGCDNIDSEAASRLGIIVTRVPGPLEREAVAEHCLALMLNLARKTVESAQALKDSQWHQRDEFVGKELRGRRIGIIGIGNIGSRLAEILHLGFQAEVLAFDPAFNADEARTRHARLVSLQELLTTSDIISLNCSLNPSSSRLLKEPEFAAMKPGTMLINAARGELLDEDALRAALISGHLGGYAADVVEGEPIDGSHPLLQCPRVIITPHLASYTYESRRDMGISVLTSLEDVFCHKRMPQEVLNFDLPSAKARALRI